MSEVVVNRYSDEDLEEFRILIEKKIEEAKKNLEEGNQVLSKEENGRLMSRLVKYISNLEAALVRIENKTYGVDRITGKLIPKERLRIVPHATLDIDTKLQEKKK